MVSAFGKHYFWFDMSHSRGDLYWVFYRGWYHSNWFDGRPWYQLRNGILAWVLNRSMSFSKTGTIKCQNTKDLNFSISCSIFVQNDSYKCRLFSIPLQEWLDAVFHDFLFIILNWISYYFLAWLFCKSIWYNSSIYICSKLSNNSISIQQSNNAPNDSIQWNNLSILHSSCTCTCNTITTTSISFTISTTHATISTSATSSLSRGMTHILPENLAQHLKWQ